MPHQLKFRVHDGSWAVCRLDPSSPLPAWASAEGLLSITRTREELSIVCPQEQVPPGIQAQSGWACLQLAGPFAFNLTGILAAFLQPLAEAGVPIFAISTYDTDWVLIPEDHLSASLSALHQAGHQRVD